MVAVGAGSRVGVGGPAVGDGIAVGGGGVVGMEDVTALPRITEALLTAGYSEGDVRKIWGGNLLRVLRQVQDASDASAP